MKQDRYIGAEVSANELEQINQARKVDKRTMASFIRIAVTERSENILGEENERRTNKKTSEPKG